MEPEQVLFDAELKPPRSTAAAWLLSLTLCLLPVGMALAALPMAVPGENGNQPLPTLAPMLQRATPAVVNIATVGHVRVQSNPLFNDPFFRRFFDLPGQPRERRTQSLGSGVVVDADKGYILTNHHVIDKAHEITVTLRDGRNFKAELIGTDADSDVAVIRIDAKNLTDLPLADSDQLLVGDFVVAIGNPFGLGQTVTSGIVSALGRSGLGIEGYEDFIQTDASINPGNSGGALVNLRGELVGINTAILAPNGGNVGIGFAIPMNMARQLMEQLIEYGEVRRGSVGITAQDLTPELAHAFKLQPHQGTVIAQVSKGSPAQRAGLRVGDIILAVDGREVRDSADVRNRIGLLRVGESVRMNILRNGSPMTLRVSIEEPKVNTLAGKEVHARLAGALLSDIPDTTIEGPTEGVLVAQVESDTPAWGLGLRKGDVIVSANRRKVNGVKELESATSGSRALLLNIQRGNSARFILIQ